MDKPYAELVAQAESAVSGVKDPELRRAAFEKVLDDLLSEHAGKTTLRPRSSRQPGGSKQDPAKRATTKRGGPQAYIEELVAEGFFEKPKTIAEVRVELGNRGHHIPVTSLSGPLQTLCQRRVLRRQKAGGNEAKKTFTYSRWIRP